MLLIRINSNKELSYTNTTSTYSNENNFDNIRIIASPIIDGKNIEDYKVELYIYNILGQEWNTFNDCIPCSFVLENNKYIFETPVKSQYTTCPRLGFYCKFIGENGVVGKTNVVETPVLYHKDNTIDASNSIGIFEKYKENILKNASDILQDSNFIYFKQECDNWSAPRIYFFNKENLNNGNKNEAWGWNDSPYMIQNEDGYYYYPLIKGYDNVIFFCDEKYYGFNYKTSDLTIPSSNWYKAPLFVQSEIGYDGFWADYNTKTAKLLVQIPWCGLEVDIYKDFNASAEYVGTNGVTVIPKIYDFGLVGNTAPGYTSNAGIRNPYKYIELPIDFTDLAVTFHSNTTNVIRIKTYVAKKIQICYEYPVVYHPNIYMILESVRELYCALTLTLMKIYNLNLKIKTENC